LKVKLLSYTQSSPMRYELRDVQRIIAYCARVSNPNNQHNSESSDKLLKYLIKNKHWSPFEMASLVMEIETTRDIARQLLRHRSFSFQEFSQRYADPTDDLSFEIRQARLQDNKNRQNSIDTDDTVLQSWWDAQQKFIIENAQRIYKEAIDKGIAKEQARAILPEGNTKSKLYVNGTIRSWIHYVELRSANGTQKEHMELAVEIAKSITKVFPLMENFYNG